MILRTQDGEDTVDDVQAIRLAKTELREAFRAGDVQRALTVFSNEYSDMSAGNASFWGAEAKAVLQHRLTKLFAAYRAELAVTIISIRILGAMAFDWGWHKLTLTPKRSGKKINRRTRYLEIWAKEPDGRWRIAIFMDNADVPPQMPPAGVLRAVFGHDPVKRRAPEARKAKSSHPRPRKANSM